MDRFQLAQVFAPPEAPAWRLRQGEVVSIQSNYTATVRIAGSTENVAGVQYTGYPPTPGAGVWIWTNGTDLFIAGTLAAAGRSIAPRVYRTSDQAISNASATPITWQADDSDAYGYWSSGTAINIGVPGRYVATAQVDFASSSVGVRSASIILGGATVIGAERLGAYTGVAHLNVHSVPFTVSSTNSVAVWVEQNSSASLNVVASGNVSPGLGIYYLGP